MAELGCRPAGNDSQERVLSFPSVPTQLCGAGCQALGAGALGGTGGGSPALPRSSPGNLCLLDSSSQGAGNSDGNRRAEETPARLGAETKNSSQADCALLAGVGGVIRSSSPFWEERPLIHPFDREKNKAFLCRLCEK